MQHRWVDGEDRVCFCLSTKIPASIVLDRSIRLDIPGQNLAVLADMSLAVFLATNRIIQSNGTIIVVGSVYIVVPSPLRRNGLCMDSTSYMCMCSYSTSSSIFSGIEPAC